MRLLFFCPRLRLFVNGLVGLAAGILCASGTLAAEADPPVAPSVSVRADLPQFDWAKVRARARIAYVSSGPKVLGFRMIDNDFGTAFRFDASDTSPVAIVELAQAQLLCRVSAAFTEEVVRLDVYLLNELPKDPADLKYLKPFVSVDDASEPGKAVVDFPPTNARYVALHWIRSRTQRPFDVAQVGAFSFVPVDPGYLALPSVEVTGLPPVAVLSPL